MFYITVIKHKDLLTAIADLGEDKIGILPPSN